MNTGIGVKAIKVADQRLVKAHTQDHKGNIGIGREYGVLSVFCCTHKASKDGGGNKTHQHIYNRSCPDGEKVLIDRFCVHVITITPICFSNSAFSFS